MTGTEAILIEAISDQRVLGFEYRRLPRIAEPHTLGISTGGKKQLLAFQIGGRSTSGRLPNWRRFDVEAIRSLVVRSDRFPRRPAPTGRHSHWRTIIAFVPEAG